jgi:hypothetical protein
VITWGYAIAADVDAFYRDRPVETIRAIVIKLDAEPAAIIGLAKEPDRDRAFSEYLPALKPHLKSMAVLRAIKAFMRWVESSKVPVYAISEGTGLLERLGFQRVNGEVFEWRG